MRISDWSSDVCSSDLSWQAGQMHGYAHSYTGYPANLQIGLAAAADSAVSNAHQAWSLFESRSVKRSEEHTSELQSLMRISYAVFCLKKKKITHNKTTTPTKKHKQITSHVTVSKFNKNSNTYEC